MKLAVLIANMVALRAIIQNIEKNLGINVFANQAILMMEAMNFVLEVVINIGNFFI